jgi:hypothetical protein
VAVGYFTQLFSTSSPATVDEVVSLVEQKVSPDMNDAMLAPFKVEEVKAALFQMNPSKAPSPDGMTALFFQKYWHIVGSDVSTAVLDFFNTG